MEVLKKTGEGFLLAGVCFLLFILFFEDRIQLPAWLQVVGRMHPMFLHFPIVLLLLSFFILWLPVKEDNEPWANAVRFLAALTSVITAIMGLLLSLEEEREGSSFQWHKWGGIAIAITAFFYFYTHSFFARRKVLGRSFTLIACLAVLLTGHWGADLTHGENYLLQPMAGAEPKKVPLEQASIFKDVVLPILQEKCVNCHGPSSIKGGLALNDTTGLLKGGKTGPLFVPGEATQSLLMKRIYLPLTHKKHMPPRSKEQLSEEEIALLHAWIQSGAALKGKVVDLPKQDSFRILAARYLSPAGDADEQIAYDFPPADFNIVKTLNNNYRLISPLGTNSPALAVHFYGKSMYSTKALQELAPLKLQITELNIARMPVKNEDLKIIRQMNNLRKLNLNYTDINDAGLVELKGLNKLENLSLSGTAVSAKGLEQVAGLPALSSIYIWDTKIDSAQVTALRHRFKNIRLETGYQEGGKTILALTPPVIKTESAVFKKDTQAEIKHPFRGVAIRYTLDGSEPDSNNSPLYQEPIPIKQHTTLTTRAFKEGWYGSKAVQCIYIKSGLTPDSVELVTMPDPGYKSNMAKTLTDAHLGDTVYGKGKWLGYKDDAVYWLYFKEPVTVNEVLVNALRFTRADIFPPQAIEVWGGMEKQKVKPLGKTTMRMPAKNEWAALLQPKVTFDPVLVKCLKIRAQSVKALPSWHPKKGKPAWVFINEITIN